MSLDFVEFAKTITILVNTGLDSSGGLGDLAGANHGGSALNGVRFAADRSEIGAAHDRDAGGGILEKQGDDLLEGGGRHGQRKTVEDGGVDRRIGIAGGHPGSGFSGRLVREGSAESFKDEGLGEDAVVAVDGGRWCRGHGEEARAWGGPAEMQGEVGSGQPGHAEISKDAVGRVGGIGEELERLAAAGSLQDGPAIGFEEDGGDGQADGVVVDGEDTAHRGRVAGIHGAFDCTRWMGWPNILPQTQLLLSE